MLRDICFHGLSVEHHHALRLARSLETRLRGGEAPATLLADIEKRYECELAPHFRIEEEVLLPALRSAGRNELANRTLHEHQLLHQELVAARSDIERLVTFGTMLEEHVRFEERELLTVCEEVLGRSVLEEVARRSPKPSNAVRAPEL